MTAMRPTAHRHARCITCGYNLFGLSKHCPECGRPFDPADMFSQAPSPGKRDPRFLAMAGVVFLFVPAIVAEMPAWRTVGSRPRGGSSRNGEAMTIKTIKRITRQRNDDYITASEAARLIGITKQAIAGAIRREVLKLPSVTIKVQRLRRSDILAYRSQTHERRGLKEE